MDQKTRFDTIQNRAAALIDEASLLGQECRLPDAASQASRACCFKAKLLSGLVSSNAVTALYTLRKQDSKQHPMSLTIDPERDFETFQERVTGIAGAEGLCCSDIADGIMWTSELLLAGAEEAARQARLLIANS